MKKFLPGLFIFAIVFFATVAIQIGAATMTDSNKTKVKLKAGEALYEDIFSTLKVNTIEGKEIALNKIKTPVVILNFWASWCGPCLSEMPSLITLKKKYKNEMTVISLNTDERDQIKNIKSTINKLNLGNDFEVVADKDTKIADSFKFSAIPVTIVYKNGKVVQFSNGPVDFEAKEFTEKMNKWIKQ